MNFFMSLIESPWFQTVTSEDGEVTMAVETDETPPEDHMVRFGQFFCAWFYEFTYDVHELIPFDEYQLTVPEIENFTHP